MTRAEAEKIVQKNWQKNGRDRKYRQALIEENQEELNRLDAEWNRDVEDVLDNDME
jgi:hypothetical protein